MPVVKTIFALFFMWGWKVLSIPNPPYTSSPTNKRSEAPLRIVPSRGLGGAAPHACTHKLSPVKCRHVWCRLFVIIMENDAYDDAIRDESYIALRAMVRFHNIPFHRWHQQGRLYTNMYATTHPSQPNYINAISGSTWNVRDNDDHL